jgi:hypothetical protein
LRSQLIVGFRFFAFLGKVTTEVCRWHSNRDIMCT